ncbi:hypothetical protein GGR57DRAFT_194099 [Xylariaceae sp. FL1272]|nr:hypothetical protein GGR57DRAFT_194099 [Xylariaceae sp. FL1272]
MSRLSRGCLRCRQRRVRCDEARPVCQRCIKRNEICEGFRDEASLIFRDETTKTKSLFNAHGPSRTPEPELQCPAMRQRRSRSVEGLPNRRATRVSTNLSDLTNDEAGSIRFPNQEQLLEGSGTGIKSPLEDVSVDLFMEKYVLYPSNDTSSPGFLEHLPSMLKEVQVIGRSALRCAVLAAAYADESSVLNSRQLAQKALYYYGLALTALGESLGKSSKMPDDYDLMTVVMLDIFETFHTHDRTMKGMHAQGMAQILRLREDLCHSPRGWSLFRLAHHRIQKEQLAFNMAPCSFPESGNWIAHLNDDIPFVHLEKDAMRINKICKRVRSFQNASNIDENVSTLLEMTNELLTLDREVSGWRQSARWAYTNVDTAELAPFDSSHIPLTKTIEIHRDIWLIYEWN